MVFGVSPLSAHAVLCIDSFIVWFCGDAQVDHRKPRLREFSPTPFCRPSRFPRTRWRSMANSVSEAFLIEGSTHLAWTVGLERLAKLCDYHCSSGHNALDRKAERNLAG